MESRPPMDPGWNDPPKMTYSPATGTSSKLKLNKRIAFPMSGVQSATPLTGSPMAPPMVLNPSTSRPPMEEPQPAETVPLDTLKNEAAQSLDHFIALAKQESEEIISRFVACRNDIDQQLSRPILQLIVHIDEAIKSRQPQKALEYQQQLMADHTKLCSQWAPAVRKIILNTITDEGSEIAATTTEGTDKPTLLPLDGRTDDKNYTLPLSPSNYNTDDAAGAQEDQLSHSSTKSEAVASAAPPVPSTTSIFSKLKSMLEL